MPKRGILTILLSLGLLAVAAAPARAAKHATVTAELNTTNLQPGQQAAVAVVVEISPKLHAQSHTPIQKEYQQNAFTVLVDSPAGTQAYQPIYPPAKMLGDLSVYTGRVVVYVPLQIQPEAARGPITLTGRVLFQACNDSGVCFLPETAKFAVDTTVVSPTQPNPPNQPDLFKAFDFSVFSHLVPAATLAPAANDTSSPAPEPASVTLFGRKITLAGDAYVLVFTVAFLVGVIFNVMPCVLPVLPLKIYGFYETAQHDRGKCFALGAVFSLGVVASFGVLGLLVLVLKVFPWGLQFTNPWFVGPLVLILVIMALSMFGAFSVMLPTGVYNMTPRHDTYTGNFLLGVLATLLATPCVAPLFPVLMLWASAQPHRIVGLLMMLMVGVGMASPYLVLSANPQWARKLPRGGPLGGLVKQFMGFLLLAVAAYFAVATFFAGRVWHPGPNALDGSILFWSIFVVIAIGCIYLLVRTVKLSRSTGTIGTVLVVAALLSGFAFFVSRALARPVHTEGELIAWTPYSEDAAAKARASGKVLMVEFTAKWCVNCQALEATVFHDPQIADAFKKYDVVPLRADLTREDDAATKLLTELNATGGIPLTAIYAPGAHNPTQLSSVYTSENLLDALRKASGKN